MKARQLQHKATEDVLAVDKLCVLLELPNASASGGPTPGMTPSHCLGPRLVPGLPLLAGIPVLPTPNKKPEKGG